MHQKKLRRFPIVIICVAALCLTVFLILIIKNQIGGKFEKLDEADQAVLTEYNTLCTSLKEDEIWEDFNLEDKTILAMPGNLSGYLINPSEPVSSIFAKKISLPKGWDITVYRLSAAAPGLMKFRFDGNFNTMNKTYSLFGNDLYYVKYDRETAVTKKWTSEHFVTFLSHESFHYYMQKDWADGSRFTTDDLTEEDISLIEEEYKVLRKIQKQIFLEDPDRQVLETAAKEYISIMDRRISENPEYLKKELEMETTEGTATYAGIKASQLTGYDFGVMYFDNKKNIPFDEVIQQYQAGNIDKSFLADRMPYETGALLCLMMDELDVPGWQKILNDQRKDDPKTIYSVIKEWSEK